MAFELNDENKESVFNALSEKGFVVRSVEEDNNFKQSHESLIGNAVKEIWDRMDKTIYEKTGIEKLIREDNGREKTSDYYTRALDTLNSKVKEKDKTYAETKKSLDEALSQLEVLKSENPESKYEEKFKELKQQLKQREEELTKRLEEKDNQFKITLFHNQVEAEINGLRPLLGDIKFIDDILNARKTEILNLEQKVNEKGQTVFFDKGQPLLTDEGQFATISDIVKSKLSKLFDESKVVNGIEAKPQKAGKPNSVFNNMSDIDAYLKDKYKGNVGSKEWAVERAELKTSSGL